MDEAPATWFLYVLRCADDSLYTGISPDVTQRLRLHESGRGARYVRGRVGVIHEHHGAHIFPDRNAEKSKEGRHLYSVRFSAASLWGEDASGNSSVYVDLWEDHLEPA